MEFRRRQHGQHKQASMQQRLDFAGIVWLPFTFFSGFGQRVRVWGLDCRSLDFGDSGSLAAASKPPTGVGMCVNGDAGGETAPSGCRGCRPGTATSTHTQFNKTETQPTDFVFISATLVYRNKYRQGNRHADIFRGRMVGERSKFLQRAGWRWGWGYTTAPVGRGFGEFSFSPLIFGGGVGRCFPFLKGGDGRTDGRWTVDGN